MNKTSTASDDTHVFADIPFEVSGSDILRAMKIARISPSLQKLTEDIAARSNGIARPKALCRISYVDNRTDDSVIINGHVFTSHVLRRNLEGVQRVFPFVATCGTELADVLGDRADVMASYCLDTVMMLAVQAARRHLEGFIKHIYGLGQVSRMAPGSLEDWPLAQQVPLFALLGDVHRQIGVRLSNHFLMTPIKSVSGIYFPTEVRFESCQLCTRRNCPGRRAEYDPALSAQYGA